MVFCAQPNKIIIDKDVLAMWMALPGFNEKIAKQFAYQTTIRDLFICDRAQLNKLLADAMGRGQTLKVRETIINIRDKEYLIAMLGAIIPAEKAKELVDKFGTLEEILNPELCEYLDQDQIELLYSTTDCLAEYDESEDDEDESEEDNLEKIMKARAAKRNISEISEDNLAESFEKYIRLPL